MGDPMILPLALHILSAVVWVGGMFFAYLVLRPSAGPLDREARLALWQRVLARFLPQVLVAILILLATGYDMIVRLGGFAAIGLYIDLMQGIGILMMLLFLHLVFAPWKRFRRAMAAGDAAAAAAQLEQIRIIVAVNLVLGLITVVIAATGRYW
jgi:uncharacterized membrane protein